MARCAASFTESAFQNEREMHMMMGGVVIKFNCSSIRLSVNQGERSLLFNTDGIVQQCVEPRS